MHDDTLLPFSLPAICRKKITAAFDGGRLSSDAGVLLLAGADRRLGLVDALARLIPDHRSPAHIIHEIADILRARIFAIACGYPDADDLDHLRQDPAFKMACGRLPESGAALASQPTIARLENAPDLRTLLRLGRAMVDLWCRGHRRPPKAITLDIDDTLDRVHGHQQLSLFNAHYDERCFLPIHVYDAASGQCLGVILRPGKTPSGVAVRNHLRRLVRWIRAHGPDTRITIRGDSHYGRPEVMAWCEPTRCASSAASAATPCWMLWWRSPRMRCARGARSAIARWCATTPRPAMPPSPGPPHNASSRASNAPDVVSIPATS